MHRLATQTIKALAACALTFALAGGAALAEDQEKAPGYRGIWFTLGQFTEHGDKYSGGLGTYTAKHKPLAIYAEEVDKTFFVYGGTTEEDERYLLCMAGYYDHEQNRVPRPTIVHDKEGVDDPHDNPSIAMDAEGHIWVFVSGRGQHRPGFKYRSSDPYCIERFELIAEQELTYPQPWWVEGEGFFHYFTKYTDGRELYWERSEDGETWSGDVKLAGFGGHYQVSRERDGRLITAFNYHPDGNVDRRTNLYYVETDDFGETWRTVDGTELDLPLEEVDNPALAHDYEADGRLVYLNDIDLDSDGHPVIQVVTSDGHEPGPENAPRYWELLRWDGAEWQRSVITESDHNYDMGSFYIEDDGHWRLIGPTATGPQPYGTGGEMKLWLSGDDGHGWSLERSITWNSPRNHGYARRPLNPHPDFYAFWADGNPDELSISMLHFTNRDGSEVWTLPYTMADDYETPVPLELD